MIWLCAMEGVDLGAVNHADASFPVWCAGYRIFKRLDFIRLVKCNQVDKLVADKGDLFEEDNSKVLPDTINVHMLEGTGHA